MLSYVVLEIYDNPTFRVKKVKADPEGANKKEGEEKNIQAHREKTVKTEDLVKEECEKPEVRDLGHTVFLSPCSDSLHRPHNSM